MKALILFTLFLCVTTFADQRPNRPRPGLGNGPKPQRPHGGPKRQHITVDENGQPVRQRRSPEQQAENTNSEFDGGARMELPVYQGNGCPQGSLSAVLAPDNKTLTVIFDQFGAEVNSNSVDRKMCRLRIPIRVSPGYQVAIVKTDLRGFMSLPEAAKASIKTTHNISAKMGMVESQIDRRPFVRETSFEGPTSEDVFIGQHVETEQVWSPCGVDFSINIGTTITVTNGPSPDQALAVVDSLDITSAEQGMTYSLNWQRCEQRANPSSRPQRFHNR